MNRRNMNNLKKGLTALAGSLALASVANAADMAVSGAAKLTYISEGGVNGDVTGNPYGFDNNVNFSASGDTDVGTVAISYTYNGSSVSSAALTIDMGDAGKFSIDRGTMIGAGADSYQDKTPRAAGSEQAWDDTDNDAYIIDVESTGALGYSNTLEGVSFTLAYAKNGGGHADQFANVDAGSISDKSFGAHMEAIPGLTIGGAYAETDGGSDVTTNQSTAFASYAFGPATIGIQNTLIDNISATADSDALQYGISFQVNDDLALSYSYRETELGDGGAAGVADPEDTGIAASYTMGSMSIVAFKNAADNVGGTSGTEDETTQVFVTFAF
jgi:hypothetical protein